MKHKNFSQNQNQKLAGVSPPTAAANLTRNGIDFAPSPDEVARRAFFIYLNKGSLPGHDLQHWLQAEAQLFAEHHLINGRSAQKTSESDGGQAKLELTDEAVLESAPGLTGHKVPVAFSEGQSDSVRLIKAVVQEAQTHDRRRADSEQKTPVVPVRQSKQQTDMKTTAGLWIDHRKAVIAIVSAEGEETLEIKSNVEKQPGRFAGVRSTTAYEALQVQADDSREREFTGHLIQFYAEVIAAIRDAESILLFGPGEAKWELKKHLERDKRRGHIIAMETTDKMTDRQIAAKAREYFHK